jgi:hypothetical protein
MIDKRDVNVCTLAGKLLFLNEVHDLFLMLSEPFCESIIAMVALPTNNPKFNDPRERPLPLRMSRQVLLSYLLPALSTG